MPSFTLGRLLTVCVAVMLLGILGSYVGYAETAALVWLVSLPWLIRAQSSPSKVRSPLAGGILIFLALGLLGLSVVLLSLAALCCVITGDFLSPFLLMALFTVPAGILMFGFGRVLSFPLRAEGNP